MPLQREKRQADTGPEYYLPGLLSAVNDLGTIVAQLRGEISTLNGVQQLGANPRPIVNSQSMRLSTSAGRLAGYSIRESAAAPAAALVRIRDGFDATGDLLVTIPLLAGAGAHEWLLPGGISFGYGLFVEVAAGTVEGLVYLANGLTP